MLKAIKRVTKAPLSYIADLRKITFKQYLLMHTNFSPSYPIMIFTSLSTTLALAIYIIFYFFTLTTTDSCFEDVKVGAYIISILYPIETILFFICITGSIALSKNNCWKVFWIFLFGPLLSGFGFGELSFIQMCLLSSQNLSTFEVASIVRKPAFIDAMVYLYISFLILYFILVPSFSFLYGRQEQDKQQARERKKSQSSRRSSRKSQQPKQPKQPKQPQEEVIKEGEDEQQTCCSRFVCIVYYFLHSLFAIAVCFIAIIKICGPILYTYVWIKIAANSENYNEQHEKILLALSLLAYFAPLAIAIVVLGIQRIIRLGKKQDNSSDNDSESKQKNTIDLSEGDRYSKGSVPSNHSKQLPGQLKTEQNNSKSIPSTPKQYRRSLQEEANAARDTLL